MYKHSMNTHKNQCIRSIVVSDKNTVVIRSETRITSHETSCRYKSLYKPSHFFFFFFFICIFIQVFKSDLQSGLPLISCAFHQLTLLG